MCGGTGKTKLKQMSAGLDTIGGQYLKLKKKPKKLFANGKVQPGTKAYAAKNK